MTRFVRSKRSLMAAVALAAVVVLTLPQTAAAQGSPHVRLDQKIDEVLDLLRNGPLALDQKIDEVLDLLRNGPPPPVARIIFASSTTHTGNLGGLAGADDICKLRATEAGLPGANSYRAWLSDSNKSAKDRLVRSAVPYVLPDDDNMDLTDNPQVAADFTALTNTDAVDLTTAINRTEDALPAPPAVWTSTEATGFAAPPGFCEDWTSSSDQQGAIIGNTARTDNGWTNGAATNCDGDSGIEIGIYCLQN